MICEKCGSAEGFVPVRDSNGVDILSRCSFCGEIETQESIDSGYGRLRLSRRILFLRMLRGEKDCKNNF